MKTNDKILKKTYDIPDEYVLEILEENEEAIYEELFTSIPMELKHQFDKYIEIRGFISQKQIEIAYHNGLKDGFNQAKKIVLEKTKEMNY